MTLLKVHLKSFSAEHDGLPLKRHFADPLTAGASENESLGDLNTARAFMFITYFNAAEAKICSKC